MAAAQHISSRHRGCDGVAEPGTVLTIRYDDTGRTETFMLGGHGAGDADKKIYPLRSPIGRAIAGACPGEQRNVLMPGSAPIPVTLLDVSAGAGSSARRPRSEYRSLRRTGSRRTQAHPGPTGPSHSLGRYARR